MITLVVDDYDEAIDFFSKKLNFDLLEDTRLTEKKRWVRIAPKNSSGFCLLLAKAEGDEQKSRIGDQTGGRVFLFLHTANFIDDHKNMLLNNIEFVREPVEESWGKVAVFKDIYGNLWDLIQPKK